MDIVQLPRVNDATSPPHFSNVVPSQSSYTIPSPTSNSPTKSIGRLEYNNDDKGPFIVYFQRVEAFPSASGIGYLIGIGRGRSRAIQGEYGDRSGSGTEKDGLGYKKFQSPDETQQRKLLHHICILRECSFLLAN
ncbi:hypothetical protein EVAR_64519_1 [Eumeta japonica]|uniref:Uncharacterized protein n=1 Tax=Eumeta variegata TaxID=151549 RepID=A0A4C2A2I5_EUMVA|nr:hypothetical protein EVAR_64519_1 [Eumeta japonica]